ncbi:uncharacterized protein [Centruroides vittatus]|uniref:uncharacterized protein n=1 Tax=Centruroides vittatus TaxID=120091 RepID=UPI00350F1DDF
MSHFFFSRIRRDRTKQAGCKDRKGDGSEVNNHSIEGAHRSEALLPISEWFRSIPEKRRQAVCLLHVSRSRYFGWITGAPSPFQLQGEAKMANPAVPAVGPAVAKRTYGMNMACRLPQLNSLWSVWYCTVTFSLQIYLVISNIRLFSSYTVLPWPVGTQPYRELSMYVASMGLAVVLLPCFVLAALLKVGNYPNDGTKLGEAEADTVVYQNLRKRRFYHGLKVVWRHSGPTAAFLHMTIAFSLLFPRLFIQAQLIKQGFLNRAFLWRTDLDFLLPPQERMVAISFLSRLNVTDILHRHQDNHTVVQVGTTHQIQEDSTLTVEFLNYTFSLLVYAVRYPSVFWRTSRWFGLLFSFQMVINTFHLLVVYAGFCILYKVQVFGAQTVLVDCTQLLLNIPFSVVLFLAYTCLLVTSGSVVYSYGIQKHHGWQGKHSAGLLLLYSLLFVALIALPVVPLMYDYMSVYCGSLDGLMLTAVLGTAIHLTLWILLWIFLTLKITCGKRNGREIPMGYSPNETQPCGYKPGKETPLFVIKGGQTYQVRERASKKAILHIIQKSHERERCTSPDNDDVYWLRPKTLSTEDIREGGALFRKHSANKNKLRFDNANASGPSPKLSAKFKKQNVKFESLSDTSDDGDYAILRDLVTENEEQENREEKEKSPTEEGSVGTERASVTVHGRGGDEAGPAPPSPHSGSDSSSGIHSPSSAAGKRASSMENLATCESAKPVWKSMSLQRNAPSAGHGEVYYGDPRTTLVIHRKFHGAKADRAAAGDEPFGRATNMKMTSFTDRSDGPKASPPSPDRTKETNKARAGPVVNPTSDQGHRRRDSANYSLPSSGDSDVSHS